MLAANRAPPVGPAAMRRRIPSTCLRVASARNRLMSGASFSHDLATATPDAAQRNLTAPRLLLGMWRVAGLSTVLFSLVLVTFSGRFDSGANVVGVPHLPLVAFLVGAAAVYAFGLPRLIGASVFSIAEREFLAIAFVAGLIGRLALFASQPILEDDYQRYLWDGAVTAHGYNPYAFPPVAALEGRIQAPLRVLAADAGPVLTHINHKFLTTIYPPVSQATFALAHLIGPWSLWAWRTVLLAFDLATFCLLVLLLDAVGRSRLWSTLYWLNPVVLKEVFNSGHMEAVILPFVLLSFLLAGRHRPLAASTALGLAAGTKFWPVLLLPLVLRNAWGERSKFGPALLIFVSLFALWLAPMLSEGAGRTNGLVAYIQSWQINSALFPALVSLLSSTLDPTDANRMARGVTLVLLVIFSLLLARRPLQGLGDLISRGSVLMGALVLLSPALFPWYTVWLAPFLVFSSNRAFLLLNALIPLYYTFFYFAARNAVEIFNSYVVWLIWAPVWSVLLWDAARQALSHRARGDLNT